MNYSSAIFLVNSDVRGIKVSYEVDANGKGVEPFTLFKTMDPSVKVGDYVVVPTNTRHKMTVCRVEEVDVEVDLDSQTVLMWLVGSVNLDAYNRTVEVEAEAIAMMKSAEKRRRKEEMRKKLLEDNPELAGLSNVTIAAALPAPLPA